MTSHVTRSPDARPAGGLAEVRARLCRLERRVSLAAQPLLLLLARAVVGYALFLTGKGKLTHLDGVIAFFSGLGIPAPGAMAPIIGTLELVGGLLLVIGLAARPVAALLTGTLAVALVTAHWSQLTGILSDPAALLGAAPTPYLMVTLLVLVVGPGRYAVDPWIRSRLGRRNGV